MTSDKNFSNQTNFTFLLKIQIETWIFAKLHRTLFKSAVRIQLIWREIPSIESSTVSCSLTCLSSLSRSVFTDGASGGALVVTAMHAYAGQQPGDLSFAVGDRITVITKTDSQYDWWEGELRGQVGIFPANFVSLS